MDPVLRLSTGDEPGPAPMPATITLGELLAAVRAGGESAAWLEDFADDEVRISADLFEVLSLVRARVGAA